MPNTSTDNGNCIEGKRQEKEPRNFWADAGVEHCQVPAGSLSLGDYAR
jgi:hypothetical protein